MIGIDTNVLVRLFVVEEPHRALAAAFFGSLSPAAPGYISLIALVEFAWVMKRRYRYSFEQIGRGIQWLLDSDDFVIESRERVEWALAHYTRSQIDFSDLVIAHSGEGAGVSHTATFDFDAAKFVPGMELLK